MKTRNSFTFKDIKVNIEGNPIELGDIHFDNEIECSVQELAQSGSFIKDVINQIRDAVKEAQASAQAYQPSCTSTPATTASTSTPAIPSATNKIEPQKTEQKWDLASVWSVMMKKLPEGFKKTGVGHYTYESGSLKEKNRIRVVIEFKQDSIDCDITVQDSTAFCHLYEDGKESYMTGINAALVGEIIEALPDDIRSFVAEYLKKVSTK